MESTNDVLSFFSKDGDKKFMCKLCPSSHHGIKGGLSNLKAHIASVHKNTAESLLLNKRKKNNDCVGGLVKTIKLEINLNVLRRGLVLYVIGKCISFRSFEDAGFRMMFGNFFQEIGETLNRETVKRLIMFAAKKMRKLLAELLQHKMICLMFDGATRHNRCVFGVKAQFIEENQIKVVGLGALTFYSRHYAENYNAEIIGLLNNVEKSVDHVYASASDTARNMLRTSRLIQEAQEHFITFEFFLDETNDGKYPSLIEQYSEDANDSDYPIDVVRSLGSEFIFGEDLGTLCSIIHCGAHVCQLAANDVTKTYEEELKKVRTFVKESKKAEHRDLFKNAKLKIPVLDTETRWDSTFMMADSVWAQSEGLRTFTNKKLQLDQEIWQFLRAYVDSFKPISLAMKSFQKRDLTLGKYFFVKLYFNLNWLTKFLIFQGDFYRSWMLTEIRLSMEFSEGNDMAKTLLDAMEKRSKVFFENDAFLSALFLDPRYNFSKENEGLFTVSQQKRAIVRFFCFDKSFY